MDTCHGHTCTNEHDGHKTVREQAGSRWPHSRTRTLAYQAPVQCLPGRRSCRSPRCTVREGQSRWWESEDHPSKTDSAHSTWLRPPSHSWCSLSRSQEVMARIETWQRWPAASPMARARRIGMELTRPWLIKREEMKGSEVCLLSKELYKLHYELRSVDS